MMEIHGNSVSLQGQFEPAVFHPAWLFVQNIENFAHVNDVENIERSEGVNNFRIDKTYYYINNFSFQILNNYITTKNIMDMKLNKLFCEIFPNIQVKSFNLIKNVHFELNDIDHWKKMGKKLAPMNLWINSEKSESEVEESSGMSSLSMYSTSVYEKCKLMKYATVERSQHLTNPAGVYVCVNFWYDYGNFQPIDQLIGLAQAEDENFNKEASKIFELIKGIE